METLWVVLALAQVLSCLGEAEAQQQMLRHSNQQLGHQQPSQQLFYLPTQRRSQEISHVSNQRPRLQSIRVSTQSSYQSHQHPSQQSFHQSREQPIQQLFYRSAQQPSPQSVPPPTRARSPPPPPAPQPVSPLSSPDPFLLPGRPRGNPRRQRGIIDLWLLPCGGQCMTRASGMCRTDYACLSRLSLPWPTERK
ncbi:mediator of RNA polymerase II transcription subunit 15-like [Penaeus indicus]|uniref:mediator of RNA polymerase II transcription subunit 15-like n=1 Tax=Penaeus indicus TaxID=29960 RepID=UPI00300D0EA6